MRSSISLRLIIKIQYLILRLKCLRKQIPGTFSIDDGHPLDWKVAELLRRYGHRGTFYWSRYNPDHEVMDDEQMRAFIHEFPEHEIGQHSYHHIPLTNMTLEEAETELREGWNWHKEMTGQEPRMFCYPKGFYHREHVKMLKDMGYVGARAVERDMKWPGYEAYEQEAGAQLYPERYHEALTRKHTNIWGHSWEIERYGLWEALEDILKHRKPLITNYEYTKSLYLE